ncbi:MAG: adenosylcobinamide-GDP ribazoletransferase [bacterium]
MKKIKTATLFKSLFLSFLNAIAFLTIIPVNTRKVSDRELASSAAFYPIAGFLIGLLLYGVCAGSRHLTGDAAASVLTVAAWLILTRGLHFDGLVDTLDGFFGGGTPSERLRIMKDSSVGAFGIAGGVILLAGKISFLSNIADCQLFGALLFVPALARFMAPAVCVMSRRAAGEGLGAVFVKNVSAKALIAAAVFFLLPSYYFVSLVELLILISVALAVTALIVLLSHKKIGGVNGDVIGFCIEVTEWLALLILSA